MNVRYVMCYRKLFGAVAFIPLLLLACGPRPVKNGSPIDDDHSATILPSHIKTIAVRPFENTTSLSNLGNKLYLATVNKLVRDGRIAYVESEDKADGVIIGTIKFYQRIPISQDVNQVNKEFQVRLLMDLKFLERLENRYLWEEPNIEQRLIYLAESQPGGKTEEEAREQLWDRFSTDIVRRTLEGFGSVTSISPRAVPKGSGSE